MHMGMEIEVRVLKALGPGGAAHQRVAEQLAQFTLQKLAGHARDAIA